MTNIFRSVAPIAALLGGVLLAATLPAYAVDQTGGVMYALPVSSGHAPAIDGNLSDWDLSAAEEGWLSAQSASKMHAKVALAYDAEALYVAAKVKIPSDHIVNNNSPVDPYWNGDVIELRVCTDPSMPYPLPANGNTSLAGDNRICHLTFWKNTNTGKDYLNIQYGSKLNKGLILNAPGSSMAIKPENGGYVLEARVPWSALNVPDGKNPFAPGTRMTAIWGIHWVSANWFVNANILYRQDPGDFAFMQDSAWGQVEFSPHGKLAMRHPSMEEMLSAKAVEAAGVPITVNVPYDGKVTVNIFGPKGDVLRELTGAQPVKAGNFTIRWNGLDQWGFPLEPGTYKWGAYVSKGIRARYDAFVGSSGNPPYATLDNRGGWGGDHYFPCGVATDASGTYFAWTGGEAQASFVKLAPDGTVIWRKFPFIENEHTAVASNGKYFYVISNGFTPKLARLDATTGTLTPFSSDPAKGAEVSLPFGKPVKVDARTVPYPNRDGTEPESAGIAASTKELYISIHSLDKIVVLDAETAQTIRELNCPGPRGVALDAAGNLYAVSCALGQKPQVLKFASGTTDPKTLVVNSLEAPFGIAVDLSGDIAVTDNGGNQQVRLFSQAGKLMRTFGKLGGRPFEGAYDSTGFLKPFGVAFDSRGTLFVAEASVPKIFNQIDVKTGANVNRWFGWPSYGVSNIPDCDDPYTCYFPFEPRGFGRATAKPGKTGNVDAYWDIVSETEVPDTRYGSLPFIQRLENGRKYEISDAWPHFVYAIEGDKMLPVGSIKVLNARAKLRDVVYNPTNQNYIEIWVDTNGDHIAQTNEVARITEVDGKPLPTIPALHWWSTMWMDNHGNAFLQTWGNCVLEIPSDGIAPNGSILWNASKARYAVPTILPGSLDRMSGIMGVRTDSKGNIYLATTSTLPALTPALEAKIRNQFPNSPRSEWGVFASEEIAKEQHNGLSHAAESNAIKFAKYAPDGHMLWVAGRKAVAQPNPGEMYNTWTMAGMIGDDYVSSSSEWGNMYVYTSDGFFVDTLMNDSATLPAPGPYTFGSETFGGRIQGFPKLGKVYAYNQGGIYAVDGFDKTLHIAGEKRLWGTVMLDKTYVAPQQTQLAERSITIAKLSGKAAIPASWAAVPTATLTQSGATIATTQIAYDDANLYGRIHVIDPTPLQNSADEPAMAFKGGDAVGVDLGPMPGAKNPGVGDIRLLAAMIHGKPQIVALKPASTSKAPKDYVSPVGNRHFDFASIVPGGTVALTPDTDNKGYTAEFSVPRSFLDFDLTPAARLHGDVEVLLSGTGMRGLQAVSRNWIFSGGHSETTMTDDIPTESWLYPEYWGTIDVR
ncbi:MAG TPA: sugar-binding protein [Capsulimonadaceae bacterium]